MVKEQREREKERNSLQLVFILLSASINYLKILPVFLIAFEFLRVSEKIERVRLTPYARIRDSSLPRRHCVPTALIDVWCCAG